MTQNYAAIRDNVEFEGLVNRLIEMDRPFGIDIESGFLGTQPKVPQKLATVHQHPRWMFVGFSLAGLTDPDAATFPEKIGWARYVPVSHDNGGNIEDPKAAARALWRLLQTGNAVAHNLQFEYHGLARWFREMLWDDTFYAQAVREKDGFFPAFSDSLVEIALCALYPPKGISYAIAKGPTGYGLKEMTQRVFNHKMTSFEDLWKDETKKVPRAFNNRDSHKPQVIEYACEDAFWCLAHHLMHYPMVKDSVIFQYEIDLIPVLCRMEREGLMLDWDVMAEKSAEAKIFAEHMNEDIQEELSERLGRTLSVNLGSSQQLSKILFDELGLPVIKRSDKTGAPSTDATSLAAISKKDKSVQRILQYREVQKLRNSYLDRYTGGLNYREDERGVPNHNQLGAITGRFSVDGVSYQQWPKPYFYELSDGTTFEFNFRDTLLSPEGFRIVGYDFSQVELRMLAGIAGEEALIQSFLDGEDVHKRTAALMLKKDIKDITKKERAIGKTLNFAIVYGAGAARIANMLTTPEDPISVKQAQDMLRAYFKALPKIAAWLEDTRADARFGSEAQAVFTPFGRAVKIWEYQMTEEIYARLPANKNKTNEEIKRGVRNIHASGDRLATNAPPQGGAGDYMKIGMVRAQRAIDEAGLTDKIRMIMTVHDALEFYVHESISTQTVIDLIGPAVTFGEDVFPEILAGYPPIKADWHEGYTWGGVFEIEIEDSGKVGTYSYEDDDKVVHHYRNFEDAVAGKEMEKQAAPVAVLERDDTPMVFSEEPVKDAFIFEFNDTRHARKFLEYLNSRPQTDPGYPVFVEVGDEVLRVGTDQPIERISAYKKKFRGAGVEFVVRRYVE